jgi:RNA polymerase sigma factor (sigma-70 family)
MKTDDFSDLLRRYGSMAYRMAFQLTGGNEADAGDLVQEAFIKIWRVWETHKPTSVEGWMHRVLHNLYIDSLRRNARRRSVSLDAGGEEEFAGEKSLADASPTQDQLIEQRELQKEVGRALARLEVEFRIPIMLCDMEGLGYDEIARIVACPVGTVRSRIHRGREQLRRILQPLDYLEVKP